MSIATETQERLSYRPEEAAAALGCSRDTIFKLLASGDLKGWKINSARFISVDELQRFITEREEESEA